jgi:Xaa-Pro aminopeptidase
MQIAPPDILAERLKALGGALEARALDAVVVTSLPNIAYLTGFFASAAALVATRSELFLIGDGRYAQSLADRALEFPAVRAIELPTGASYDQTLVTTLTPLAGLAVGFESSHISVRRHQVLTSMLAKAGWTGGLSDEDGIVDGLRVVKDQWEVGRLRDGAVKLSSVAKCILSNVLAGRTEADVAAEIEAALRRAGFERPAFDTIVAGGPNAALPHARASQRQIEPGDLVVLDFGGVLDGYCTDLTRTVVAGRASLQAQRLIEQVIEAQAAAFGAVRPGAAPEAVDEAARDVLGRAGLADAFTHGTGHGLGLEIHEAPRVSKRRAGHTEPPLGAGMVLTLEPGAYLPGWGGVRIEDDVLVTAVGAEWLTDVPRVSTAS